MILVMFMEKYLTIRSVFSKASDLPITIERLNATTYVYSTVKKYGSKSVPVWMFNFLSFNGKSIVCLPHDCSYSFYVDPDKPATGNRTGGKWKKTIVYVCACLL